MSCEMDERLNQVLQLFLSPDYDIASTTYFDLLLSHIAENTSKGDLNQHKIYESWILSAVQTWESRNEKPRQGIVTFTLKLVGIIAQDERYFQSLNQYDTLNKLCKIFELEDSGLSASVKMAYITMLCNLTGHYSGRRWITETEMWRTIIEFAHSNHTVYITRECKNFLITFLNHEQANVELCEKIVLTISEPLITRTIDTKIIPAMEDSYMDQNRVLCATLDLITNIIEDTLFVSMDNSVPLLFERIVSLEIRVRALFEACISTRFLHYVHKLLILIMFMKLKRGIDRENSMVDEQNKGQFRDDINYICFKLLSKKFLLDVMKTFKLSLIYWKKLRALCEFTSNYKYRFEMQAIAITVLPLSSCLKKAYINCDLFDMFLNKMFDVTCMDIQRLAYNIRDILLKEEVNVESVCKASVEITLETINIMDRDVAVIAFQTMCHVLKNYTMENEITPDESEGKRKKYRSLLDGDPISQAPALLSTLLDGLVTMTEKFKLKWQECVETICVLSHAQKIVSHPAITPNTCVKALKLFELAIENFMPPNLVLLVDSESHMSEVGETLYKRLHDPNWEIQDSVLEVLNTIAVISEHKYPAYQLFLLKKDFLQVAIDLMTSDGDSYVRASAFTFVTNTIKINQLWDEKLSKCDLLELAIKSIRNEDEAIVRREAVALINELYIHRRWNKPKLDAMTQAMATAVLLDLHWEVKVNGLKFWKNVIYSHLTDQGMLDGSFPNVTFSKEHKKIVSLNETEIKQRLNKVLDELAKQNCLGVLLAALKDESDFEVCKTSAQILCMFKKILTKYKVNEPLPEVPLPKDSATIDSVYIKQNQTRHHKSYNSTLSKSANVIEDIVVDNDTNLLNSIYMNTIRGSDDATKSDEPFERIQSVTKENFLQTIFNYDFNAYIKEKDCWLKNYTNSFESILEDILTVYQSEVNLMDCY